MRLKADLAACAGLAVWLNLFVGSACAQVADPASNQTTSQQENQPAQLPEVVVIGNLNAARNQIVPSLGGTEYTINPDQLNSQSQGVNSPFNQVLLRTPGMAEDSFGQLHIRGEHANLQYRINDVLIPEGISGFGSELDTRFADSVSLITGSLPAQYGLRTAGVVDIHTKNGAFVQGGSLSAYGGSFNTFRPSVEYGGSMGGLNYYVTGSYFLNALGIENSTASRNAIHDNTEQPKGFGYLSYIIDDTSRINLMLSASDNHFQIPNSAGQVPAFTLTGVPTFDSTLLNERQREQNYYTILAYQKSAGKFDFQASSFSRYSSILFQPDHAGDLIFNGVASYVDRSIYTVGFQLDSSYALNDQHTLRAGTVVTSSRTRIDTATAVFPTDSMGNQISSTPVSITDNGRQPGYLSGVYVQDEWKILKPLTINFGARFDWSSAFITEYQFSPRVNVVYKATEQTTFHAGYARYFTPPPLELVNSSSIQKFNNTTNASAITQDSPVKSERAHYFDLGVTHQVLPGLQVGLDGYYKIAENQLDEGQFGQALIFSPFNYKKGDIKGIEFTTTYKNGGFSSYLNFAVSKATGKSISSAQFLFDPSEFNYINHHWVFLDHDQRFTGSIGSSYDFKEGVMKDTTLYADLLAGSGLRKGFANTQHVPAYVPVNLGFYHTFPVQLGDFKAIQFRFDVVNVFDEVYKLRDGSGIGVGAAQFGMRRGFFGGLSFLFGRPPASSASQSRATN
jgi:outer membrane receptor protein involved in Fe transport